MNISQTAYFLFVSGWSFILRDCLENITGAFEQGTKFRHSLEGDSQIWQTVIIKKNLNSSNNAIEHM